MGTSRPSASKHLVRARESRLGAYRVCFRTQWSPGYSCRRAHRTRPGPPSPHGGDGGSRAPPEFRTRWSDRRQQPRETSPARAPAESCPVGANSSPRSPPGSEPWGRQRHYPQESERRRCPSPQTYTQGRTRPVQGPRCGWHWGPCPLLAGPHPSPWGRPRMRCACASIAFPRHSHWFSRPDTQHLRRAAIALGHFDMSIGI